MKNRLLHYITFFLALLLLLCTAKIIQAQTIIEITSPMTPPNWAILERELL